MDKQNVNTTPSMKRKGDSSSSHYRISSGLEECACAVATKFVQWEVQPLETLCACEAYLLRVKLNRGEAMSSIPCCLGMSRCAFAEMNPQTAQVRSKQSFFIGLTT